MASWHRQDRNTDADSRELAQLLAGQPASAAPVPTQQPLAKAKPVVRRRSNPGPTGTRQNAAGQLINTHLQTRGKLLAQICGS